MSTLQNSQAAWTSLAEKKLDPKYEKCRNITEEIYKRINITFQIKKLESGEQSDLSDNSDQIDSNELSNETDLFACDKSDISSSTEAERTVPALPPPALINNNNNEERSKTTVYKKPRKRFRKRVKKRVARKRSDSEGSSDEAPLSRTLLLLAPELKTKLPDKPLNSMTLRDLLKPDDIKVPTVIIEKIKSIDKDSVKQATIETDKTKEKNMSILATEKTLSKGNAVKDEDLAIDKDAAVSTDKKKILSMVDERKRFNKDIKVTNWKNCSMCSLSFRGERGLRRHISMSHIETPASNK